MASDNSLSRVALAISAYRSDASVTALLRQVFAGDECPFGAVIVVDSQGAGAIRKEIEREGWPVDYHDSLTNLGSAGNLARRLELAAGFDMDWCCAVNHDVTFRLDLIRRLLNHAEVGKRIGAAYPKLVFTSANDLEDRARKSLSPFSIFEGAAADDRACVEVAWSSSNGALYNLAAIREGIEPWPELWMGWEDLALGWQLSAAGWGQILCNDVRLEDSYEYRKTRLLGKTVYVAAKPPWYSYYQLRNLLIIRRRSKSRAADIFAIALRGLVECAATMLFRERKAERVKLLFMGLLDGLRGVTGKGPVP
jgi:GT2 family glycosyltransferase